MLKAKEKQTCLHNWIHNAGKQCEWDNSTEIEEG